MCPGSPKSRIPPSYSGRLIVLEGADGVGKSTLSRMLYEYLISEGVPSALYAFPGCTKGAFGELVYSLHHEPTRYRLQAVNALSMQMLHVAAHVDCVEGYILPDLRAGKTIVLDRSWLSTKIYGLVSGVPTSAIDKLLDIERDVWDGVSASQLFIIRRKDPLKITNFATWYRIRGLYDEFLSESVGDKTIIPINNDSSVNSGLEQLVASVFGVDVDV